MKRAALGIVALFAPFAAFAPATAAPEGFRVTRVASLEFPTGMQWTASGERLFVNERAGRVRVLVRGRLNDEPVATLRTDTSAESGLLGLALHPRFEDGEPWLYVFFTRPGGREDVVERLRIENDRATTRQVVMRGLTAGAYHHGGSLAFGRDGKLYVAHGESHETARAQDRRALGGKIYRLNPDGSVPDDNPFGDSPAFAIGLRNPFGMAHDPETGLMWVTENGPSDHDEVNVIERGKNYGWPRVKGNANDARYTDPVRDYAAIIVPTMAAFGGAALPEGYRGSFFFGSFRDNTIRMLTPTEDRRGVARESAFHRADDGVISLASGPDGLYFTTPSALWRAAPPPGSQPSPEPSQSGSITPGPSASASAAGPAGDRDASSGAVVWLVVAVGAGIAGAVALAVRRR